MNKIIKHNKCWHCESYCFRARAAGQSPHVRPRCEGPTPESETKSPNQHPSDPVKFNGITLTSLVTPSYHVRSLSRAPHYSLLVRALSYTFRNNNVTRGYGSRWDPRELKARSRVLRCHPHQRSTLVFNSFPRFNSNDQVCNKFLCL